MVQLWQRDRTTLRDIWNFVKTKKWNLQICLALFILSLLLRCSGKTRVHDRSQFYLPSKPSNRPSTLPPLLPNYIASLHFGQYSIFIPLSLRGWVGLGGGLHIVTANGHPFQARRTVTLLACAMQCIASMSNCLRS